MSNVVAFKPAPVTPYLGAWVRDPISVSRLKVAKRILGEEGLKRLWACASIADLRAILAGDAELAGRYARCEALSNGRLEIAQRELTFISHGAGFPEPSIRTLPIASITTEGRTVTAHLPPGHQESGYALRMNKQWLLVSVRFSGRRADLFPPSPVFRFYRDAAYD